MGVCSAVREMALAIDAAFGRDDPRVGSVVQALESMPSWFEQRRLDQWEEEVTGVLPAEDQSSLPISLLVAVFEFGRFNLYGAFQPEKTSAEFRTLTARLSKLGLVLDDHQSVSDW
jgi:hypothetical protein